MLKQRDRATITVQYVNAPSNPKGPGSVKDATGRYWKVWDRDVSLDEFSEGQAYTVEFETSEYNGKPQYYIKRLLTASPERTKPDPFERDPFESGLPEAPAPRSAPQAPRPAPQATWSRQATSPVDAERMFTCSIVNAYVEAGRIPLAFKELNEAVELVRDVWRENFGSDQ